MAKSIRPAALTVVLSGAAVLGYLGYRWLGTDRSISREAAPVSPASAPTLADSLPQFELADLAGHATSIASWPDRPMVINFWATWCAPCLREIPLLKAFQVENPGVQVVGIAVDRFDPVVSFAGEMDFNYPILVGETDGINAAAAFGIGVLALPITVFTDRAGAILGIHTGEVHPEHLENYTAVLADLAAGRADRSAARARIAGTM
jgi:thiol-disulfide isomerase/thioredoxin